MTNVVCVTYEAISNFFGGLFQETRPPLVSVQDLRHVILEMYLELSSISQCVF